MILLFSQYGDEGFFLTPEFWIIAVLLVVSFFLRAIPPFKYIWYLFLFVIIGMLLGFFIDRGKNRIKDWWDK